MIREERKRRALVGRIEIAELAALGLQNRDPLRFAVALRGGDESRLDPGLLPSLNAISRLRDIEVPLSQRLFAVEMGCRVISANRSG
jgi:hypothetical protein